MFSVRYPEGLQHVTPLKETPGKWQDAHITMLSLNQKFWLNYIDSDCGLIFEISNCLKRSNNYTKFEKKNNSP